MKIKVPVIVLPGRPVPRPEELEFEPVIVHFKPATVPLGELVDQIGTINKEFKLIERWLKMVKEAFKSRVSKPSYEISTIEPGSNFVAKVSLRERKFLSKDKLIAHFGSEEALEDFYDVTTFEEVRITTLDAEEEDAE